MTRTLKITALALLSVIVLWACGGSEASMTATQTAQKFLDAVQSGDWSTAEGFATDDTKEVLETLESFGGDPKNQAVDITSEEIDGTTATILYTLSDDADKEMSLSLIKDGDDWKAETTKADLTGGSDLESELLEGLGEGLEELGEELQNMEGDTDADADAADTEE